MSLRRANFWVWHLRRFYSHGGCLLQVIQNSDEVIRLRRGTSAKSLVSDTFDDFPDAPSGLIYNVNYISIPAGASISGCNLYKYAPSPSKNKRSLTHIY